MPKTLPLVTAWSYSRYADYKQCPAKFKYKHLDHLPDPGSPAMQRGNDIHKMAENFINLGGKVPRDLANVADELKFLRKAKATAEENWGFRNDWEWIGRQGWFGDDVWFRAKTDVRLLYDDDTLLLGDWKTGRKYFSNEEQIQRDWTRRAVPMFKDRRFAPTPNDKCGWCPFSKAKGGPCKF
jgi:hypothetical protein